MKCFERGQMAVAGGGLRGRHLPNVLQLALDQAPHDVVHRLLDVQEVDVHGAGLPNPVRPVLGLQGQRTPLDTVLLLLLLKKKSGLWLL